MITPDASKDVRGLLANQFLMRFSNNELESRFWRFQHSSRIFWIRAGLFLAMTFTIVSGPGVIPFASELLPGETATLDQRLRNFLLAPMYLGAWVATFLSDEVKHIRPVFVVAAVLTGVSFSSMIYFSGPEGIVYYNYNFLSVLLFIYVILVQPFQITFFLTFGLAVFHVLLVAINLEDAGWREIAFVISPVISTFVVLSYGSYFTEYASRSAFASNLALNKEYEDKLAVQEQRSNWLGLVTDFLRHEMKNSMIGISSSLQLIQKRNKDVDLQDYVSRARKSIDFMWRMLEEASRATSLESALSTITMAAVDLPELVRERMTEYREMYPEHRFEAELKTGVTVEGDAGKLIQLLDKLVNNAAEHADVGHPIRVSVDEFSGRAVLRVSDTGDALKVHGDTVFQPFVSKKARGGGDNFGLGLYVVKRIAAAHQGQVAARGLEAPTGAEFSVFLPLSTAASGSLCPVRS